MRWETGRPFRESYVRTCLNNYTVFAENFNIIVTDRQILFRFYINFNILEISEVNCKCCIRFVRKNAFIYETKNYRGATSTLYKSPRNKTLKVSIYVFLLSFLRS